HRADHRQEYLRRVSAGIVQIAAAECDTCSDAAERRSPGHEIGTHDLGPELSAASTLQRNLPGEFATGDREYRTDVLTDFFQPHAPLAAPRAQLRNVLMDAAMQAFLMLAAIRVLLTSTRRRLAALRASLDGTLGELLAE